MNQVKRSKAPASTMQAAEDLLGEVGEPGKSVALIDVLDPKIQVALPSVAQLHKGGKWFEKFPQPIPN